jgi:hypothetical protein
MVDVSITHSQLPGLTAFGNALQTSSITLDPAGNILSAQASASSHAEASQPDHFEPPQNPPLPTTVNNVRADATLATGFSLDFTITTAGYEYMITGSTASAATSLDTVYADGRALADVGLVSRSGGGTLFLMRRSTEIGNSNIGSTSGALPPGKYSYFVNATPEGHVNNSRGLPRPVAAATAFGDASASALLTLIRPPTTHVLSVGVRDTGSNHGGDIQAQRVKDALVNKFPSVRAGISDTVLLDTNNSGNLTFLTTKLNALRDSADVQPGDTFVFYINGHGFYDAAGDEATVRAEALSGTGTTLTSGDERFFLSSADPNENLTDDTFSALFVNPKWQQINKLFIVDTCFAGGLWGSTISGDTGDLSRLNRAALIAASTEQATSFAHLDPATGLNIGNLGEALIAALADPNLGNTVGFHQLFNEVRLNGLARFSGGNGRIQDIDDNWGLDVVMSFDPFSELTPDFEFALEAVPEPSVLSSVAVLLLVMGQLRMTTGRGKLRR